MEKKKRFYKPGEIIWIIGLKKEGKVVSIDKNALKVVVSVQGENGETAEHTLNLWDIDKLKYAPKKKLLKEKQNKKSKESKDVLYFAKVRLSAKIPSKRDEDASYDLYANIEPRTTEEGEVYELLLKKGEVTFIPTGIASYMDSGYFLNLKNERSSVAKLGLVVLAGCVDSKFQGEIMVMAMPLRKDILITSKVQEVEEHDDVILYPYQKAIAQANLLPVPKVEVKEITYEELLNKPSQRKTGGWGSSGK